ncbi:2-amino-4-hydroxy-6-hydroxymethyldihydropteridine diphosphokinase [Allorhizobium undicola]|uniref:2-amino-4-hydroxy-6- hydroxymethyldihydropteridine diphosphokinase n=1 Tax=Allorhizobium undicola TaxID=78527 RepID=UPI00048850E5|nr:2-amino-4-hydroxy-6-hydroxymethyldihydropteridine diphosphokinase [Allorhizobium undicola]
MCDKPLPVVAALGLGGNLGDPAHAMATALQVLNRREDCSVIAVSPLYRTPPWGKTDQNDFLNACALVNTTLDATALLAACLQLERCMKRERLERWGPRTLDIDILLYGDERIETEELHIPHPRMLERAFVLKPLADIAGDWQVEGRSVHRWLAQCDSADIRLSSENSEQSWWQMPAPL